MWPSWSNPGSRKCWMPIPKMKSSRKGRPRIGIYTLPKGSFPAILHQKTTAGVSLAVVFTLSCRKISLLGVLRSFEGKIFVHRSARRLKECFVHFKAEGDSVEKKIPSKPCKSLCGAAQRVRFSKEFTDFPWYPGTSRTAAGSCPKNRRSRHGSLPWNTPGRPDPHHPAQKTFLPWYR